MLLSPEATTRRVEVEQVRSGQQRGDETASCWWKQDIFRHEMSGCALTGRRLEENETRNSVLDASDGGDVALTSSDSHLQIRRGYDSVILSQHRVQIQPPQSGFS